MLGRTGAPDSKLISNYSYTDLEPPLTADGQVRIGVTGSSPVANTLTAGGGVTITNGQGTITISSGGSTGTFPNITLTDTTNQIKMGTTKTTTLSSVAPATSQTITLPDSGSTTASILLSKGNQSAAGIQSFTNATASTSTVTGGVVITGGLGIGGDIYLGNTLNIPNTNTAGTVGTITLGGSRFISNFGTDNTFIGAGSGNTTLTGSENTGVGINALGKTTTGKNNSAFGSGALENGVVSADNNTAMGGSALFNVAGGADNTALGYNTGSALTSGSSNLALGKDAGSSWGAAVSNNICIANVGSAADSGVVRIGTSGTHTSTVMVGTVNIPTCVVGTTLTISGTGITGGNGFGLSISDGILNVNNGNNVGRLRLYNNTGAFYSGIRTGGLSASTEWILPTADATGFMVSDGSANLSLSASPSFATTFSNTTNATSTSTGSIITSGGIGVAKDIWCANVFLPTSGGTPTALNFCEVATVGLTPAGAFTTNGPNPYNVSFTRIGNMIMAAFPSPGAFNASSTATGSFTGIPARFQPTTYGQILYMNTFPNAVNTIGSVQTTAGSGTIAFYSGSGGVINWTNTQSCNWSAFVMTWPFA